jgi:hypothetical protein
MAESAVAIEAARVRERRTQKISAFLAGRFEIHMSWHVLLRPHPAAGSLTSSTSQAQSGQKPALRE